MESAFESSLALSLTIAKVICYSGLAIPAFAYLVDRYLLRPRLRSAMFVLACIACYTILLVALFITDGTGIDDEIQGYFRDDSGTILFKDEPAPIPLWQSIEGRRLFPLSALFLVPVWSLTVYLVVWLVLWLSPR